jgi:peptide/nickel transport system substrate-binding protein
MSNSLLGYENFGIADRQKLETALRRGASRRDILNLLVAGGMSAALGAGIVTGATKAYAATPKKGGRLRVATYASSTADTLDPAKAIFNIDYLRINSIYDGMTRLDEALVPQMELAEAIETRDAKSWTVKLRRGVTFHDGSAFTADDVVFSLKRHTDPAVGSNVKAIASQFESVEKSGDDTVQVVLKAPNADLPTIFAIPGFRIVKNGTTDFSKGIGTGPFAMELFKPGERSICVANKNYWRQGAGPYIDAFELFAIQDESARTNALISGDVDVIANVNPRSANLLTTASCQLLKTVAGQYTNLIMRVDTDPGKNADFVKAIKFLLDREKIKQAVFRGFAEIANDQPIPPSSHYYAQDLKAPEFDPDQAKSLLSKAGLLNTKIPIVASSAAEQSVEIAVLLQQAAQKIGLDIEINRMPSDGYWSKYWMRSPISFGSINPRPSPDVMFSQFYASESPNNESGWKNERFDKLLAEARGMTDEMQRKEIYGEIQKIVSRDCGTAIPTFITGIDGYNAKVKGFRPMPTGNLMGNAFPQHVWIEG